jgi:hypothetical protein
MKALPVKLAVVFCLIPMLAACLSGGGGGDNAGTAGGGGGGGGGPANTIITHTVGTTQYTWTFTCGGGPCLSGTFLGGDYWIAPKQVGEQIILTAVTTNGQDAGLEVNPSSTNKQGFLSCLASSTTPVLAASYDSNLDKAGSLPLAVAINQSLVKATKKTTGCPAASGGTGCCIDSYDVLSVLPAAPINNGLEAFRPGFAGTTKTVYYLTDFDFTVLPSEASVSSAVYFKEYTDTFADIYTRWHTPFVDHFMQGLGDAGRLFAPLGTPSYAPVGAKQNLSTGYGADLASAYLGNLIRGAMGNEPLPTKMPAITGLLQRGIDLYVSYKAGIRWPTGAAQQLGRKPPVVFFAATLNGGFAGIKAEVQGLAAGNAFQEDGQINKNVLMGNIPLWGDPCTEHVYWSNVLYEQLYKGNPSNSLLPLPIPNPRLYWPYNYPTNTELFGGDNSRTCADPYGWIDGPGGLPGTEYMENATGPLIGFQVAQSLMSNLCTANNDSDLSVYTRRIVTTGTRAQPDGCAPPDPRENLSPPLPCSPSGGGTNCNYYGVTWGPANVASPNGACIPNGLDPITFLPQNGRFVERDASLLTNIYSEPQIGLSLRTANGALMSNCN